MLTATVIDQARARADAERGSPRADLVPCQQPATLLVRWEGSVDSVARSAAVDHQQL